MLAAPVSLDLYEVFGDTIETFRSRRERIIEGIWSYQIESKGPEDGEGNRDVKRYQ